MSLNRLKPYKAKDPYRTINEIRSILEKNKIFTIEYHPNYASNSFFDCRVILNDEFISGFNLGTNGKGLSRQYALASAYGEFMERIQNVFLFDYLKFGSNRYIKNLPENNTYRKRLEKSEINLDFSFFSDEKNMFVTELIKNEGYFITHLFKEKAIQKIADYLHTIFKNEKIPCVPYLHVRSKKIHYLPAEFIRFACGSNGMCAGNTKDEALIQGICEIFERYVLKKIFTERITPPTIPLSVFNNTAIFKRIQTLESEFNYKIIIKDCSLGIGLPVIGVIVADKNRNKYAFSLGADPSYITALERCLTEFYQGDIHEKFKDIRLGKEKKINSFPFEISGAHHYFKSLTNNTGEWPVSIFRNTESYEFTGFDYTTSKSDTEDMNHLTSILSDLNYDLFVRDVSILNFPAFHIYIPGMSESHILTTDDLKNQIEYYEYLPTLLNIANSSDEEIVKFLELMVYAYKRSLPLKGKIKKLFLYNENKDLTDIPVEILIFMLSLKTKRYKTAYDFLSIYLDNTDNKGDSYTYLLCAKDYLYFLIEKIAHDRIIESLNLSYGENLTKEIIGDLSDDGNLFSNYNFPSCFNCENCKVSNDCKYFHVLKYVKFLQIRSKEKQINQEDLIDIFY